MSVRCFVIFLAFLTATVRASLGDMFVPKSGGTVTFLRTELADVLPDPQETVDFLALRTESAIETALSSAPFTELLERKIAAFGSKYPSTKFRQEIARIVDGLKADQLRLANGSVKIAGVWIGHDQLD